VAGARSIWKNTASRSFLRQMPADEYPNLRDVAIELIQSGFNYADEFEFGLDLILDGLEQRRAAVRTRSAVKRQARRSV
jgi:hypothetical protein